MYFLADDKFGNVDLWVTDGTTTEAVGDYADHDVTGHGTAGSANGLWLTDGTAGGTTEVGVVSPGTGKPPPFNTGNPERPFSNGLRHFRKQSDFLRRRCEQFQWPLGYRRHRRQHRGTRRPRERPDRRQGHESFADSPGAFFNAPNKEGDDALWVTDGTANGTVELGGVGNAGIVGSSNNTWRGHD